MICSLVHKFGRVEDGQEVGDIDRYVEEVRRVLSRPTSTRRGNCSCSWTSATGTQSGKLHGAMRTILPNATVMGFTGTPLLKKDKKKSVEIFGRYVHTYKFDQAVADGVVLDIRYEARDIDQRISSPRRIDSWFDSKTADLTDVARAELKKRWGTLKSVFSSQDRLEKIAGDVLWDMERKPRLKSGRGNALLVCSSIYEACKYYEIFARTDLGGKVGIVTSYRPAASDIKGEESGEGQTEKLRQYAVYRRMLSDWFHEPDEDKAMARAEEYETAAKKRFVKEPGRMKLLIVVAKLLTGFNAPSATYLYIDKSMRDHDLFQAICRVNRLDGESKEYGYVVDYKDLFAALDKSVTDYTGGEFEDYDPEDVEGLVKDRLKEGRTRLDETRDQVKALCEPVAPPKGQAEYFRYFSSAEPDNDEQRKENEPKRLALYKHVAAFLRAYVDISDELAEAGYTSEEIASIRRDAKFYAELRDEIKLHSGDAIDLKLYEPAMRRLIDSYISAEHSRKVSTFDDMTLVQLIVERGVGDLVKELPDGIAGDEDATAETVTNNVRKVIVNARPVNPKYYDRMSDLLDDLIAQRRAGALAYQQYLKKIERLVRDGFGPDGGDGGNEYPASLTTAAQRAIVRQLRAGRNARSASRRRDPRQQTGRLEGEPSQTQKGAAGRRKGASRRGRSGGRDRESGGGAT